MYEKTLRFFCAAIAVGLMVVACFAVESQNVRLLSPAHTDWRAPGSLDSADVDTIQYDDGHICEWGFESNYWARVRFTAPFDLQIRSAYFVANNQNHVATVCSVKVWDCANGDIGHLLGTYAVPSPLVDCGSDPQQPVWNDYSLTSPITIPAGCDFFTAIGPQTGGALGNGWHFYWDRQPTGDRDAEGRYNGNYSGWTWYRIWRDCLLRVGVEPATIDPARGYVTLFYNSWTIAAFDLTRISGFINRVCFSELSPGTTGGTWDAASSGWVAESRNDSIIFTTTAPFRGTSLGEFVLNYVQSPGHVKWTVGDSSGYIDVMLPVELISFAAESVPVAIDLRFATASENNVDRFEIYRAESATGEFRMITQIRSQGNSSTQQNYSYRDGAVQPGRTYWYYLADVSVSGERTTHTDWMRSARAGDVAMPTEYTLSAYPNPFNPTTTLAITLPEASRVNLCIYDVTGKLVRTLSDAPYSAGRHEITFDAGALPTGIYMARLEAGSVAMTRKLLLIK